MSAPLQDAEEVCGAHEVSGAQTAGEDGEETLEDIQSEGEFDSESVSSQVHPEEEELITVDAVGCFQEEEEIEVADEEEDGKGAGPKEEEIQVNTEQDVCFSSQSGVRTLIMWFSNVSDG